MCLYNVVYSIIWLSLMCFLCIPFNKRNEELEKRIKELKNENEELKKQIQQEIQKAIQPLNKRNEDLEKRIKELKNENEELKKQIQQIVDERIEPLNKRNEELEKRIKELENIIAGNSSQKEKFISWKKMNLSETSCFHFLQNLILNLNIIKKYFYQKY